MRQTVGRADPNLSRARITLACHSRVDVETVCMTRHAVYGFGAEIFHFFHHPGKFVGEIFTAICSPGRRHGSLDPLAILKPVVLIADADRFDIATWPTAPFHVRSIGG